tara:strand:+ start:512 stop:727 length:216 start_codon:yes stop_codon:yes gene_type:complete
MVDIFNELLGKFEQRLDNEIIQTILDNINQTEARSYNGEKIEIKFTPLSDQNIRNIVRKDFESFRTCRKGP